MQVKDMMIRRLKGVNAIYCTIWIMLVNRKKQ